MLPVYVIRQALADFGLKKCNRWGINYLIDFNNMIIFDSDDGTTNALLKLYEQLGEAVPQAALALLYLSNNKERLTSPCNKAPVVTISE